MVRVVSLWVTIRPGVWGFRSTRSQIQKSELGHGPVEGGGVWGPIVGVWIEDPNGVHSLPVDIGVLGPDGVSEWKTRTKSKSNRVPHRPWSGRGHGPILD